MSDSAEARALVATLTEELAARFGTRLVAVYQLGSLARGGFSATTSDIDVGLLLGAPLTDQDDVLVNASVDASRGAHPAVDNPVSVFWGSIDSVNGETPGGRFPPFDRLDLIENGELLAGADVRDQLQAPTYAQLVEASADFAVSASLLDQLRTALADISTLTRQGPRAITKLVLFPVRFLYLLHTGEVAANAESASHYLERFPPPGADLVAAAIQLRAGREPRTAITANALADVWLVCVDAYTAALPELGLERAAQPLGALRSELLSHATPAS